MRCCGLRSREWSQIHSGFLSGISTITESPSRQSHEFDGGLRYTRRYTGRGVEGHMFERVELPGGRARSRLVVEADEQSITPRFEGAAPVPRKG